MKDDAICLLCDGNLIEGSETNETSLHEISYQTCENCGCYGFYLDQEEKIRLLDKPDRITYLEHARADAEDDGIPLVVLWG